MLRDILEKSFSILLNLSTISPKLFWVIGDLRPSFWGWTKSEGYTPPIISFQHSWLVSVLFLYWDGKGTNVSGTLGTKLYSSLRKGSHIQLSLVIQVTRGRRKMPFRPLKCGERNPSQLYHCPPLVDSCLSTYCINTQREPKFFGGNAKERNRKDIVDCLPDEHFPPKPYLLFASLT